MQGECRGFMCRRLHTRELRYAIKILYELCLGVVLCLTKPAFMRRPWRITPCPAVHGRAFLFFLGIILQSLSSFAIRLLGSACALPDARRLRHALPTKKKKNLISKELHEKSVYSIMIVQENKTEDHEF